MKGTDNAVIHLRFDTIKNSLQKDIRSVRTSRTSAGIRLPFYDTIKFEKTYFP